MRKINRYKDFDYLMILENKNSSLEVVFIQLYLNVILYVVSTIDYKRTAFVV